MSLPTDATQHELLNDLQVLNQITETLNRAANVRAALQTALSQLIDLMQLETGWLFLRDTNRAEVRWGRGFFLVAHRNLPPALALDRSTAWDGDCRCQKLCLKGELHTGYNEVKCSRLNDAAGDTQQLAVHASTPLAANGEVYGILNVAGREWDEFSPRSLALLNNVGAQMAIALERARLYGLLQERHVLEQSTLLDLSNKLLRGRSLDELMPFIVSEARRLLDVDACALLLPGSDFPGYLKFQAASGWNTDPVAMDRRVPADERSGSGTVMRTLEPMLHRGDEPKDPGPTQAPTSPAGQMPWLAPWVDAEGFVSSAIIPLVVEDRAIGTIVVNTRTLRDWQREDLRFLQLLANQAAIALETARLRDEELAHQRIERDLAVSRDIQHSLLPADAPQVAGWGFGMYYQPARTVGGDFYDFFTVPGESYTLGLLIADVAGKGISAALFMALARTIIRSSATSPSRRLPAAALKRANQLIVEDNDGGQFLSVFYARLDLGTGRLLYNNAGHNPPLIWRAATGQFSTLTGRGIIIGVFENISLADFEDDLRPGDLLICYTDGVTEAMNAAEEAFGLERLRETIAPVADQDVTAIQAEIVTALQDFTGNTPQSDDITFLLARRHP